eukprot:m51a1_g14482 hypothetical protein (1094) ;mRNA; r:716682-721970
MASAASSFDENKASAMMDLYSRQIGAFGVETMKNLITLDILVVGCKGVGAEVAKNIILAGPRSVALYDPSPVAVADLNSNCFFHTADIGRQSAEVCVAPLAVLNPYVNVRVHAGDLSSVAGYGAVVVAAPLSQREVSALAAQCRARGALLVVALVSGVVATLFADYGAAHAVTDADGEAAKVNVIERVDKTPENTLVITVAAENHELSDGTLVTFDEVEGLEALSKVGPVEIARVYVKYEGGKREKLVPNKFVPKLDAAFVASLGEHVRGGVVTEVKRRTELAFRPFDESLVNPKFDASPVQHPDASKAIMSNRGDQLHFARIALWRFQAAHNGELPRLHSAEDAAECVALAKAALAEHQALGAARAIVVDAIDEPVVAKTALYARAELPGLATFVGGVAAQELVKKFGKFTPLRQWMHMDYFELVPDSAPRADAKVTGSRYDHQISVIGREAHEKLTAQKWFMVGCGALGCEYLKGFALMGLGTGATGLVSVTDMDRIEVSNLNRQFLFRKENVGQQKSATAAKAAKIMNPDIKVRCYETKVGPETEDVFDDAFWESQDGVCNALDNVIARRYVDSRCVWYERPLMESGTLGTKANSEVILPHKTMSYGEQKDPEQGNAIPMCTLRNFPHLIDHCIEWARAQFTEVFEAPVRDAQALLEDPAAFMASLAKEGNATAQLEKLLAVQSVLQSAAKPTFEGCVQMAVNEFQKQYSTRIRDLTHSFPKDAMKKDPNTGKDVLFWSGTKRFPNATTFDPANPMHADYAYAAANLFAATYGLEPVRDRAEFDRRLRAQALAVPAWAAPRKRVDLMEESKEKEGEQQQQPEEDDEEARRTAEVRGAVEALAREARAARLVPADFEKDDDSNFHIDFITACANMRAWNYHIKEASRHQCKMIAGRIIPAIATTTAAITGLICMELYKLVLGLPKQLFYSSNMNLATNTFELFEPENPGRAKSQYDVIEMADVVPVPDGFTVWDKAVVDAGDLTVDGFLEALPKAHHGVTANYLIKAALSAEDIKAGRNKQIYSEFCATDDIAALVAANRKRKLRVVYEELYGALPKGRRYLVLDGSFNLPDGNPAKLPPIKYVFARGQQC